jgi:hypothetical protein
MVPVQTSCVAFPFSSLSYDLTYFQIHEPDTKCTTQPRTVAQGALVFTLSSARKVWIAGDQYGQTQNLSVDNFIVFKFSAAGTVAQYWVGGSEDSFGLNPSYPYNITVNGSTIPFHSFGSIGNTPVTPPNLTDLISVQPNKTYTLEAYAQDAGVVGQVSDVYVIFE